MVELAEIYLFSILPLINVNQVYVLNFQLLIYLKVNSLKYFILKSGHIGHMNSLNKVV